MFSRAFPAPSSGAANSPRSFVTPVAWPQAESKPLAQPPGRSSSSVEIRTLMPATCSNASLVNRTSRRPARRKEIVVGLENFTPAAHCWPNPPR